MHVGGGPDDERVVFTGRAIWCAVNALPLAAACDVCLQDASMDCSADLIVGWKQLGEQSCADGDEALTK